jgi:hypothetical protein
MMGFASLYPSYAAFHSLTVTLRRRVSAVSKGEGHRSEPASLGVIRGAA